jgi:hypothetical protein
VYHQQNQRAADLLWRDEERCERRSRAARECLREEIGRADHPAAPGSEQDIEMYLGLLESMSSSALATTADKAQCGSNQALQTACRLELAARRHAPGVGGVCAVPLTGAVETNSRSDTAIQRELPVSGTT